MKKPVFLFMIIVFIAIGCKYKKPAEYTTTHPYFLCEKMNGKVAKVSERTYWAEPDGDKYKKGKLLTSKERDSIKWDGDKEITFDTAGNERICMWPNENDKYLGIDLAYYTNNKPDTAKWIWGDTLQGYAIVKCNDIGKVISMANYFGKNDTL